MIKLYLIPLMTILFIVSCFTQNTKVAEKELYEIDCWDSTRLHIYDLVKSHADSFSDEGWKKVDLGFTFEIDTIGVIQSVEILFNNNAMNFDEKEVLKLLVGLNVYCFYKGFLEDEEFDSIRHYGFRVCPSKF